METYTFWREQQAKFSELAKREGASSLHAIRADDVDVQAVINEFSDLTCAAIANPAALPDSVYGYARTAARAGRIKFDGEQFDRWFLSGGPNDELARAGLHNDFKAEATMAAVGADAIPASTTDQAALEAWLELICRSQSPENPSRRVIQSLAHASTVACNQLASRAYRNGRAATQIDAPPGSSREAVSEQARLGVERDERPEPAVDESSAPAAAPPPTRPLAEALRGDTLPEVLSVTKAAKLLDVSSDTIRRMVRRGELEGLSVGRQTRITKRSIKQLRVKRNQP